MSLRKAAISILLATLPFCAWAGSSRMKSSSLDAEPVSLFGLMLILGVAAFTGAVMFRQIRLNEGEIKNVLKKFAQLSAQLARLIDEGEVGYSLGTRLADRHIKRSCEAQKFDRLPACHIAGVLKFLTSKKYYERTIEPIVSDAQWEYVEAVAGGEKWKARWIKLGRVRLHILLVLALSPVAALMKKISMK